MDVTTYPWRAPRAHRVMIATVQAGPAYRASISGLHIGHRRLPVAGFVVAWVVVNSTPVTSQARVGVALVEFTTRGAGALRGRYLPWRCSASSLQEKGCSRKMVSSAIRVPMIARIVNGSILP